MSSPARAKRYNTPGPQNREALKIRQPLCRSRLGGVTAVASLSAQWPPVPTRTANSSGLGVLGPCRRPPNLNLNLKDGGRRRGGSGQWRSRRRRLNAGAATPPGCSRRDGGPPAGPSFSLICQLVNFENGSGPLPASRNSSLYSKESNI